MPDASDWGFGPSALMDSRGGVYVWNSEEPQPGVACVDPLGKKIATVPLGKGNWDEPTAAAIDAHGDLILAFGLEGAKKFNTSGKSLGPWGIGGIPAGKWRAISALAATPEGGFVAISELGHTIVTKTKEQVQAYEAGQSITRFDPSGKYLGEFPAQVKPDEGLPSPVSVAVAPNGDVFVADDSASRIVKYDPSGKVLATWKPFPENESEGIEWPWPLGGLGEGSAASGTQTPQPKMSPGREALMVYTMPSLWGSSITKLVPDGMGGIYAFDLTTASLLKFDASGKVVSSWTPLGKPTELQGPPDYALDTSENIYITDGARGQITKLDSSGKVIGAIGSKGEGDGKFTEPAAVCVDQQGNVYVVDVGSLTTDLCSTRLLKFDSTGKFLSTIRSDTGKDAKLVLPSALAPDGAGGLWILDMMGNRIQKLSADGKLTEIQTEGIGKGKVFMASGVFADKAGNLFCAGTIGKITSKNNSESAVDSPRLVRVYSPSGKLKTQWPIETPKEGESMSPGGVCADESGNVYIAVGNPFTSSVIRKYSPTGKLISRWKVK